MLLCGRRECLTEELDFTRINATVNCMAGQRVSYVVNIEESSDNDHFLNLPGENIAYVLYLNVKGVRATPGFGRA